MMSMRQGKYHLTDDDINDMVSVINSNYDVLSHNLIQVDPFSVYTIDINNTLSNTKDTYFLNISPKQKTGVITEPRIITFLHQAGFVVPEVVGVVDRVDCPYFLMKGMGGVQISYSDLNSVTTSQMKTVAAQSGELLARLHNLGSLADFGRIRYLPSSELNGEVPTPEFHDFGVKPSNNRPNVWKNVLKSWINQAVEVLNQSKFGPLTEAVKSHLHQKLNSLEFESEAVMGRIDHGFHNILMNSEGEIEGNLDWGFTLAVPPLYDLVCVEYNLTRNPWCVLYGINKEKVRETMTNTYIELSNHNQGIYNSEKRTFYEVLALVRTMAHMESTMEGADEHERIQVSKWYIRELKRCTS